MTRKTSSRPLDTGDVFPSLTLQLTDGKELSLPAGLTQPFNVVLVTRGAWCPFCIGQLKAFQVGLPKLNGEGIGVVSLSTDPLERARSVTADNQLTFPIAYGASVDAVAEALGTFYNDAPSPAQAVPYLQSAGFVLAPGGKILNSVYSSGAIGRLMWQDVISLVQYVRARG